MSQLTKGSGITFLAYDDVKGRTLEFRISKLALKLVRNLDLADRATDGAVHWKSMGPKLRHARQKEGGHTFIDSDWLEYLYNGSEHTEENRLRLS